MEAVAADIVAGHDGLEFLQDEQWYLEPHVPTMTDFTFFRFEGLDVNGAQMMEDGRPVISLMWPLTAPGLVDVINALLDILNQDSFTAGVLPLAALVHLDDEDWDEEPSNTVASTSSPAPASSLLESSPEAGPIDTDINVSDEDPDSEDTDSPESPAAEETGAFLCATCRR